jgi:hypothetical protein
VSNHDDAPESPPSSFFFSSYHRPKEVDILAKVSLWNPKYSDSVNDHGEPRHFKFRSGLLVSHRSHSLCFAGLSKSTVLPLAQVVRKKDILHCEIIYNILTIMYRNLPDKPMKDLCVRVLTQIDYFHGENNSY